MVDLQAVAERVPELDIEQLRTEGLAIVYEPGTGRLGANDVRQIINVICAVHPDGEQLFIVPPGNEDAAEPHSGSGLTFAVDIPNVQLIPTSSPELPLVLGGSRGAVLDLRAGTIRH